MTLFECLVYIVVLAAIVNMTTSIFISTSRMNAMGTVALDRLEMRNEVRKEFSGILRQAAAIVPGIGAYHTGEDALVMELPPATGNPEIKRYAVLGFITAKDRVSHMYLEKRGGDYVVTACSTLALPVESLHFGYDKPDPMLARLVQVEMGVANTHKGKSAVPLQFTAGLRCRIAGGVS
jgi:hypothetical protein